MTRSRASCPASCSLLAYSEGRHHYCQGARVQSVNCQARTCQANSLPQSPALTPALGLDSSILFCASATLTPKHEIRLQAIERQASKRKRLGLLFIFPSLPNPAAPAPPPCIIAEENKLWAKKVCLLSGIVVVTSSNGGDDDDDDAQVKISVFFKLQGEDFRNPTSPCNTAN